MKKIIKGLGLLLPLLLALGIELVASVFCVIVFYQAYLYHELAGLSSLGDITGAMDTVMANMPMPSAGLMQFMFYMIQLLWTVCFYFWYSELRRKEGPTEPGIVTGIRHWSMKGAAVIFILSVGYSITTGGLLELILPNFEDVMEKYNELMEIVVTGNPFMIFVSTVILAPLSEEFIFRGIIMKKAMKFSSFMVANILQALLFGIFHLNIVQGIYAFGIGLGLGYVAYKFKSVWAAVLMHLFFNGLSFVIPVPAQQWILPVYVVVGIILIAVALRQLKFLGSGKGKTA